MLWIFLRTTLLCYSDCASFLLLILRSLQSPVFKPQIMSICFYEFVTISCIKYSEREWRKKSNHLLNLYAAKSLQWCPTLCDLTDGSPPGSPVPRILQARTLEWVAISFSNAWKWKVKRKSLSHVWLLATPWTAAYQAPPSMGFSRQEYWSGVPLPSPNVAPKFP